MHGNTSSGTALPTSPRRSKTAKFAKKREDVITAATHVINDRGFSGMTFVEVAEMVGLNTSSVTYYFRLKEQLAEAAFQQTLDRIEALVQLAGAEPTPRERVSRYLALYIDLHRRIRGGEERPIAILSDVRALDDSVRISLMERYSGIFRQIRLFFGPVDDARDRALNTARAQVLTETIYWLPVWLFQYSYRDFNRIHARMMDLFEHGLAPRGAEWKPELIELDRDAGVAKGRANFLKVATRLVSELGYRGASVERIAAELNVTKGSFYHHLDAKDDLILDCFRHSYATIATALETEASGDQWHRLTSVMGTLLDIQLAGDWPLLRTTALQTLPPDVRVGVLARANRMALSIAGVISDGVSEGTIRGVDPLIAAHAIMPGLNAAYELHNWATRFESREKAVAVYASTLIHGLFDPA